MAAFDPAPDEIFGNPADLIENLGADMAARYADAEQRMIERIARLVRQGLDDPEALEDLAERQRVYAELRREGERIARELADPDYVAELLTVAAEEGREAAVARLGIVGIATTSTVTPNAAAAVAAIALDLSSSLDDMGARIVRWMPDIYRRVISTLVGSAVLGAETARATQARAVEQFLSEGVGGFVDSAGRTWRIGTYSEMATRTAVARAWRGANEAAQLEAGLNLCTIAIGASACRSCAENAGKVFSLDGTPAGTYLLPHATEARAAQVVIAGTIEQARAGRHFTGPNCRCVQLAYFVGLPIPEGKAWDPAAEAARDRLRYLERKVRKWKRREAASLSDVGAAAARRKVKAAQAEIREHVARTGVTRKSYREQLHFSDGKR